MEPRLKMGRERAALSVAVLAQLATAALAMLAAYSVFHTGSWTAAELAQGALAVVLSVVVCNRCSRLCSSRVPAAPGSPGLPFRCAPCSTSPCR